MFKMFGVHIDRYMVMTSNRIELYCLSLTYMFKMTRDIDVSTLRKTYRRLITCLQWWRHTCVTWSGLIVSELLCDARKTLVYICKVSAQPVYALGSYGQSIVCVHPWTSVVASNHTESGGTVSLLCQVTVRVTVGPPPRALIGSRDWPYVAPDWSLAVCACAEPVIVTEVLSITHCRVLFCLLHHAYEGTSRFIETCLGEPVGNIDFIVYIYCS